MDYIYKNIEENSLRKKCKILIVFDDTITDVLSNGKINPIVTEASIRDRMLNIPFVLIIQFYFDLPKNISRNSTQYFIMKIPNKRELLQTAFTHSLHFDFKDFISLSKKYAAKPYYFLVIDDSRFRKDLLERI